MEEPNPNTVPSLIKEHAAGPKDRYDTTIISEVLNAETDFFKSVEASVPSGICVLDSYGYHIYVNRSFCNIVGWPSRELIGQTYPYPYWLPQNIKPYSKIIKSYLNGNFSKKGHALCLVSSHGKKVWVQMFGAKIESAVHKNIGIVIAIHEITNIKRLEKKLTATNRKFKTIAQNLLNTLENDRRVFARELHDGLLSNLGIMKLMVENHSREASLNPDPTFFDTLIDLIQVTIKETRDICTKMSPTSLYNQGFTYSIDRFLDTCQEGFANCRFIKKIEVLENEIPEDLKIVIYRIIQEALNNVIKHSRAQKVMIQLTLEKGKLILKINDSGVGLNLRSIKRKYLNGSSGMGLLNMKQRTEISGGKFTLRSFVGQGTTIISSWNMRQ